MEMVISVEEEEKLVRELFEKAFDAFKDEAFQDGIPIMCQIHNTFGTFDTANHNCLGCNFSDSTELILSFLITYPVQKSIQYSFTTYIMLLYLLVERIDTLFNIMELNSTYRKENFKVLVEVRKWANFLKHPKTFILTHHPIFTYEGMAKNRDLVNSAQVIIDRNFVDTYYSDETHDNDLYKKLENKDAVLVIFPDALRVIKEICKAMCDCVAVIDKNPVYKSVLESKTTFNNYWVNPPT